MKVIRFLGAGAIKLLMIFLILVFILASLTMHFTQKEVLSPIVGELALVQLQQNYPDQFNSYTEQMQTQCDNEKTESISYAFGGSGGITINCTNLKLSKEDEMKNLLAGQFGAVFDKSKDMQCRGYECVKIIPSQESFLSGDIQVGLFSKAFADFLGKIKMIAVIGIILLAVALVLILENWPKRFVGLGLPLLINGLPYFFLGYLQVKSIEVLPAPVKSLGEKVLGEVFAYISNALLCMFVIGFALVVTGIVLKYTLKKEEKDNKKSK